MRKVDILLAVFVTLFSMASTCSGAEPPSIAGRWVTFDDDTKEKRAVVEVLNQGRHATGRIVELYLQPGEDPEPICASCRGSERDRQIRGLTILSVDADENEASYRGTVLDPEEGRTYHCVVTLQPDGRRLLLRGYLGVLGIEIFGREAIWVRSD